jgi:type I restriction enzyme R subunit
MPTLNEADTCRLYVTPQLQAAGWDAPPYQIREQRVFTDGRIIVTGGKVRRGPQKRADYLLHYRRDVMIAVVEAKAEGESALNGVQQAREYAEILGLRFAYATNGHAIIEIDYLTGAEREIDRFPTPEELWRRLVAAKTVPEAIERGVIQFHHLSELMKTPPFDRFGLPGEIAHRHFGGIQPMRQAIAQMQAALYQ